VSFLSVAFGKAFKARRKELGLNQAKAAEGMGTEGPTISRWESGEFLPVSETIDKTLKVLKLSGDEFLRRMAPVEVEINPPATPAEPTYDAAIALLSAYQTAPQPARALALFVLSLSEADFEAARALFLIQEQLKR